MSERECSELARLEELLAELQAYRQVMELVGKGGRGTEMHCEYVSIFQTCK